MERGQNFYDLKDYITNVKMIITYGECKKRIEEFANSLMITVVVVDTLENAVKSAYDSSSSGDVILLSPASASWDQYKCFEDRGDEFKKIVNSL